METPIPNYKKYLFEQLKLNITCVNDLYIYIQKILNQLVHIYYTKLFSNRIASLNANNLVYQ